MKKLFLLITGALLFSGAAFADTNSQNGISGTAVQDSSGVVIGSGNNVGGVSGGIHVNPVNIVTPVNIAEGGNGGQGGRGGEGGTGVGVSSANTGPVTVAPVLSTTTKVPRQAPAPASSFSAGNGGQFSCLAAIGASATAPIGGLAFNTAMEDRNCQRILLSREIRQYSKTGKYDEVALGLLCRDDELREEMAKQGLSCGTDTRIAALNPGSGHDSYKVASDNTAEWPSMRHNH